MITTTLEKKTFWFILNLVSANQITTERWCRSGTAGWVKHASIRLKGVDVVFTTFLQKQQLTKPEWFLFQGVERLSRSQQPFLLTVHCICNVCSRWRRGQFFSVAIVLTLVTAVCQALHLLADHVFLPAKNQVIGSFHQKSPEHAWSAENYNLTGPMLSWSPHRNRLSF